MQRIVIFASGTGTNAQQIVRYFKNHLTIQIMGIWSNNPHAKVLQRAKEMNVPSRVFTKNQMQQELFLQDLQKHTDYIILAGFLLKIPQKLTQIFLNKIINIHPSLLPKYGGAGMYGMHVHKAVAQNKEPQTGITIHFVNENYDQGTIIFQKQTNIHLEDTPAQIAEKVHILEHKYFSQIIEKVILEQG